MSFRLFVNSATYVEITPEWEMEEATRQNQSVTRTPVGALYMYRFGSFRTLKVPMTYVNCADRTRITSWWGANTALYWHETGRAAVAVRITNDVEPFAKRVKPYFDRWQGTLELESV